MVTPTIYVMIIGLFFVSMMYYPNRDFDRSSWDNNPEQRYEMAKDIISSKLLIGKTKKDVIAKLGLVDTNSSIMTYYLGVPPQLGVDEEILEIVFKDDKVNSVTHRRH